MLEDNPLSALIPIHEPHITGLHIATVVGPSGKSIYTDKYGRLKIQFAWDAHGKHNENSFAWVRVRQAWAGDGYGFHTTPRLGQEVLVSFDHGNPDKPFIIGNLPNDTALPPFTPDKTPTQSGFQSKSLDNDAEAPGGHQFIFEDDAKKPSVKLHSQRNLQLHAAEDFTQHVGGKSSTTVLHGNYVHHANGRLTIKADKAVHLVSGQSRISVTDSDIIIEADQIAISPGGGVGSSVGSGTGASPDAIKNAMAATNASESDTKQEISNTKPSTDAMPVNGYPSAEVQITNLESTIGPTPVQLAPGIFYMVTATNSISTNLTVKNKKSVNPVTFDKHGFGLQAKNETAKILSNLQVKNAANILKASPSLTLYNDYGIYNFSGTSTLVTRNQYQYTGTLSKEAEITDGLWQITGNMDFDITVTLTKEDPTGGLLPSLQRDLQNDIGEVKQALRAVFEQADTSLQNVNPSVAQMILGTIMILAIPAGF